MELELLGFAIGDKIVRIRSLIFETRIWVFPEPYAGNQIRLGDNRSAHLPAFVFFRVFRIFAWLHMAIPAF